MADACPALAMPASQSRPSQMSKTNYTECKSRLPEVTETAVAATLAREARHSKELVSRGLKASLTCGQIPVSLSSEDCLSEEEVASEDQEQVGQEISEESQCTEAEVGKGCSREEGDGIRERQDHSRRERNDTCNRHRDRNRGGGRWHSQAPQSQRTR